MVKNTLISKDAKTIDIDPEKLYLILSNENEGEGFGIQVIDRTEDNVWLACLLRGMIDYAVNQTEACVEDGANAFKADLGASGEEDGTEEDTFPPTIGNA